MTRCLPRVSRPPRGADCSIVRQCATSSYMRKWMTERLKRRKKPGEGSAKETTNAPAPLQPRFYDNEPDAPPAAPVAAPVVESPRRPSRAEPESVPAPEPVSAAAASSPASAAGEPRPRTSRRRRSRGGRGGGRSPAGGGTAP